MLVLFNYPFIFTITSSHANAAQYLFYKDILLIFLGVGTRLTNWGNFLKQKQTDTYSKHSATSCVANNMSNDATFWSNFVVCK
mmetsp:Transcript_43250/g.73771  ORF Transcript_43250/g.73771 Transcript_43250/m.73771 type:complete len:83 (+) Transcript_43250:955-1203(+)